MEKQGPVSLQLKQLWGLWPSSSRKQLSALEVTILAHLAKVKSQVQFSKGGKGWWCGSQAVEGAVSEGEGSFVLWASLLPGLKICIAGIWKAGPFPHSQERFQNRNEPHPRKCRFVFKVFQLCPPGTAYHSFGYLRRSCELVQRRRPIYIVSHFWSRE